MLSGLRSVGAVVEYSGHLCRCARCRNPDRSRETWSGKLVGVAFSWGTLIINVTGSFLIGAFIALFALKWDLPQVERIFLTVGICGGYTTFSTFSVDAYYLMERGEALAAAAYMIGSLMLSVVALIGALHIVRTF